jgi:hypothetical protein
VPGAPPPLPPAPVEGTGAEQASELGIAERA